MTGHGSKYNRRKDEAIAALLTQRNMEEAAKSAGIGTQTLLRWQKLPEFQAAYREARRAAVSQAAARLQQASGAAASTLCRIMVDVNMPPAVRARAAFCILSFALKAAEIEDLEARMSSMEKVMELRQPGGKKKEHECGALDEAA